MLHFYRFNSDVLAPVPASPRYGPRRGRGSEEDCPPMRAYSAFGWDILSSTDMVFLRKGEGWELEEPVDLESDFTWEDERFAEAEQEGVPLHQRNAWFWEEDQILPHPIDPAVFPLLRNQVKVSTLHFLATDANELLAFTDIPGMRRSFRVLEALVDTDWYPASYPWHCVLELDPNAERVEIARAEPLCRVFSVRREHYFAREMSDREFDDYFRRSQEWIQRHRRGESADGTSDIRGAYGSSQSLSRFSVII
ncbi:MAG: hypothetical protein KDB53_01795 [Planctomycetes bacterium]|nr:hypothetical protein [Planctomycetota bacterium]